MAKQKGDFWKRLWSNYVFRNIVLAVSLFVILMFVISVLLNIFTRHNKYKDVPDFVGITLGEAERYAHKDKLRIEVNDSLFVPTMAPGAILEQKPSAGAKVKSGRRIFVTVNSSRRKMVEVPYVVGYSLRQAKNILETAGLEIERLEYREDMATNNVLAQRAGVNEVHKGKPVQAEVGSGIVLVVGRAPGAAAVMTPRLVGLGVRDAKGRLWESGLNYRANFADGIDTRNMREARVWKQSPEQGMQADYGQNVTVWFSVDSLTIANGMTASDAAAAALSRERFIADSLSRAGYSGEQLEAEKDWIRRIDRGEASPADRPRSAEEIMRDSDPYERQEVPVDAFDGYGYDEEEEDEFFY